MLTYIKQDYKTAMVFIWKYDAQCSSSRLKASKWQPEPMDLDVTATTTILWLIVDCWMTLCYYPHGKIPARSCFRYPISAQLCCFYQSQQREGRLYFRVRLMLGGLHIFHQKRPLFVQWKSRCQRHQRELPLEWQSRYRLRGRRCQRGGCRSISWMTFLVLFLTPQDLRVGRESDR